jgi:glycine oxidase
VRCTAVVIAAGAWSGQIAGTAMLPVAPVRGQMLAVRAAESIFRRVIASPRCYLIPRADGRLLIGATVEDAGFQEGTTEAGMTALRNAAVQLAPGIAALPVTERWFGFRPGTPDGLPVLGEDERIERLFYATGHYRNGILLAPVTAAAIAALIAGDRPPVSLAAFSPGRFR